MKPVAVLLAVVACATPLEAQVSGVRPRPDDGSVSGTVLAAETGQPLVGAVAVLEATGGATLVVRQGLSQFARALTAVTDDSGAYRFSGLPEGTYRLLIRDLGYHPAQVTIDLARGSPFRLSVGLVVNPIRLEAIDTRAPTADPYGRHRDAVEERTRGSLDAEEWRREHYVEGDARVLLSLRPQLTEPPASFPLLRRLLPMPGAGFR